MKKRTKVVLIVLGALISVLIIGFVILGSVVGWELMTWQNFRAAIRGITTTSEELEKQQQKSKVEQVDVLEKHGFHMTYEDLEKIETEGLTKEQIKQILLGGKKEELNPETTPETDGKDQQKLPDVTDVPDAIVETNPADKEDDSKTPDVSKDEKETEIQPTETKPSDKPLDEESTKEPSKTDLGQSYNYVDERTAEIVAQMYVYKSQYSASISSIVSAMCSEFYVLPSNEQTYSNKVAIYDRYSGQIATMEAQCDAQVYSLINELRTLLRENGRDESLADSLASAYETEKENTKAYYVNQYAD